MSIVVRTTENGKPAYYEVEDYSSLKRIMKGRKYTIVSADRGSITQTEMLKERYGLSKEELEKLVRTAKSQPEAIAKVKARVKRWDWTLERLVSHMWSHERWKKEDPAIASQVQKELEESLRLATRLSAPRPVMPSKRIPEPIQRKILHRQYTIHMAKPDPSLRLPSKPVPHHISKKVERNTGVKTVPRPQPRPSTVVKRVTATSTAVEVHEPEKKSRFGLVTVLGVVAVFLILKKVMR